MSAFEHTGSRLVAPWVRLRSVAFRTFIYQKMVGDASPDAQPGSWVNVYDKQGTLLGHGLYNPRSAIAVRMLAFGPTPAGDAAFWRQRLADAWTLRRDRLRLDDTTNAYRVVHAEGDEITGLIVDRYDDVLSIEVHSLGVWQRLDELLPLLHELTGCVHHHVQVDEQVQKWEGFTAGRQRTSSLPAVVEVHEHGLRFRVEFEAGHKTGFFCDQRDNRRRLAQWTAGADVLDLCCYTGGFGLYAKALGEAKTVTCVDLDESAIALARRNANLNQVRLDAVHADAFTYMRQMQGNSRQYGVVVLDPPKLVFGKNDTGTGRHKYADLNRLAATLVAPGGLLLTCSCSGALLREEFNEIVLGAVRHAGRDAQILDQTGAGPDHPVSPRCPESSYLKALWLRLR